MQSDAHTAAAHVTQMRLSADQMFKLIFERVMIISVLVIDMFYI